MKRISILMQILFSLCLFVFNGCGLDVVSYFKGPEIRYNYSVVEQGSYTVQSDVGSAYVEFQTRDADIKGDLTFLGTGVYYRIYNNFQTMNSHNSTLSSLSTSTNESAAAAKMLDLKYQPLGCTSGYKNPLIDSTLCGRDVYIRLTNNNEPSDSDDTFKDYALRARIFIGEDRGGKKNDDTVELYPMRYGDELNFDFGRKYTSGKNKDQTVKPVSGDDDVEFGTESSEGMWYVNLYAVAVCRANDFSLKYSNILHLGSIAIDSKIENN